MKGFKLYFILIVLAFFSCRKKQYPPSVTYTNDVVFSADFSVNGLPFKLESGKNNYYMYSSYNKDTNNIYNFVGLLKQKDCNSNCANSLRIQISNYGVSGLNGSVKIDSALYAGLYSFLKEKNSTGYTAEFTSSFNKTASSYLWDFGDGTTSTLPNPSHNYKNAGKYKVCLTINSNNGCQSSICNTYNVSANRFHSSIAHSSGDDTTINFSQSTMGGKPPYKYLWNFGDGKTDTVQNPTHNYKIQGAYRVILTVRDADNNIIETNYNVTTAKDQSSCRTNMNLTVVTPPNMVSLFSKVMITWVDSNGRTYSSFNPAQPNTNNFEILSVEDYSNNELSQKTKKLKVKFACDVYSGSDVLRIDTKEAMICVAYK